jgi:hypothetical protein
MAAATFSTLSFFRVFMLSAPFGVPGSDVLSDEIDERLTVLGGPDCVGMLLKRGGFDHGAHDLVVHPENLVAGVEQPLETTAADQPLGELIPSGLSLSGPA